MNACNLSGRWTSIDVPVGTGKEDLQQIAKDEMQIFNWNYVQSIELVK